MTVSPDRLLDPTETRRLASLETIVERGLDTFVEVGEALREIRNSRLYRAEYETFEAYCRARWDASRTYANRMIAAAEVAAVLPIGTKPQTESQARELVPLRDRPEQLREVMQEASANGRPTAKAIRTAVEKRTQPAKRRPAAPAAAASAPTHGEHSVDEKLTAACEFIRRVASEVEVEGDPERWLRQLLGTRQAIDGLIERSQKACGADDLSPDERAEEQAIAERAGIELGA